MHADDTNYTVIKNGVVVVSGTGPAIRVDGNRLIIRDGPQETPPLCLTRAEASRKLRHIVVCGHAGRVRHLRLIALVARYGRGLFTTRLGWSRNHHLRSARHGSAGSSTSASSRLQRSHTERRRSHHSRNPASQTELNGQAEVARFMGSADAGAAIGSLAGEIARETDGKKVLVPLHRDYDSLAVSG